MSWSVGGLRAVVQERFTAYAPGKAIRLTVTAVVGVVSMLAINQFVVTAGYEPSGSMEPTVLVADHFLLDKISPQVTGLFYGDVVELPMPSAPEWAALKRVIGLPGDTITCVSGQVLSNGSVLDEPYLSAGTTTECDPATVPSGSIYVLGDHRLVSMDSRDWGPIDESAVHGRLIVTF